MISHEIGQWCAYPNLAERSKYTGHLKAKNFDIFADSLAASGMADQAADFLHASGKLQALLYKEDVESALRTPGMGGFQLLDLHDFPGQGTALVGVLDPFWDSKGYVTADEFRRFCGTDGAAREARPARLHDGRDAGGRPRGGALRDRRRSRARGRAWRLVGEDGRVVARGALPARDVPVDNGIALGRVSLSLAKHRRSAEVPARRRASRARPSRTTGTSGCTRRAWTRPRPRACRWCASSTRPRRPGFATAAASSCSSRPAECAATRSGRWSSASRASSGTRRGRAARRRTRSASSSTRSTPRSPRSRPRATATGSGGTS